MSRIANKDNLQFANIESTNFLIYRQKNDEIFRFPLNFCIEKLRKSRKTTIDKKSSKSSNSSHHYC